MSKFYLEDGTPCSLERLCRESPEWAASRIRSERAEHADLRALAADVAESLVSRGLNIITGLEYEAIHAPVGTWLRAQQWKRVPS